MNHPHKKSTANTGGRRSWDRDKHLLPFLHLVAGITLAVFLYFSFQ